MCRLRSGEPSSQQTGPLAERPFDLVDCLVGGGLRLEVGAPFGVADRATGLHQSADETGPLRFVETGFAIRHSLPRTTK
jgi:hypothetical protein